MCQEIMEEFLSSLSRIVVFITARGSLIFDSSLVVNLKDGKTIREDEMSLKRYL